MFDDAFVDAFITAADQNHLVRFRKSQRFGLIESPAGSGEDYHYRSIDFPKWFDGFKDRFRLENHSFATAKRPVVYSVMVVGSEISQIVDPSFDESFLPAAPDHTEVEGPFEKVRKNRDYIKNHFEIGSFVQFPQAFRQIHFDSPLIQVDLSQIRLRKRDQRLLLLTIHLQDVSASHVEHVGYCSDVLAVDREHATALQLKGVEPAFFGR